MRPVFVTGCGLTRFGRWPQRALPDLAEEAGRAALREAGDARPGSLWVASLVAPCCGQADLARVLAQRFGLDGVPAARIEAGGASGAVGLRAAWLEVASGACDAALVIGCDKLTQFSTPQAQRILAATLDRAAEGPPGVTPAALFALVAREHMRRFGTTRAQLSAVAVKSHSHAVHNPCAHLRRALTREQVEHSPPVADPLRMLDCAPLSDGAAALVLSAVPPDAAPAIELAGLAAATAPRPWPARDELAWFETTQLAAQRACAQAGVEPGMIDLAEVHDAFTIAELCALEALGLCPRGAAGPETLAGATAVGGRLPVNASGGLKARGHPFGASGVAQVVELVRQLRGQAGAVQVPDARCALAHSMSGCDASAVVTILRRHD